MIHITSRSLQLKHTAFAVFVNFLAGFAVNRKEELYGLVKII